MSAILIRPDGAYCPCGHLLTRYVFGPAPEGSEAPRFSVALPWTWHRGRSDRLWTHGRHRYHTLAPGSRAARRLSPSQAVQVRDHVRCPGCRALLTPPA